MRRATKIEYHLSGDFNKEQQEPEMAALSKNTIVLHIPSAVNNT
jgi:hypothetical protein